MKCKLLFALVIVALFINLAPIPVNAGLFDNLIKDLQKNIPNTGSDAAKVKSQKKFQEGNVDYSSSSIIGFLCQKSSLPGLPKDPAPDPQAVANDFGKTVAETRKILTDNFSKSIGPKWARSLPYYRNAFDQSNAKMLFNAFIASNGRNIKVLSQLKKMSELEEMSQVYREEASDARFSYGLVLLHYKDFHKRLAFAEGLMKTAENENQSGALYIGAKKYYYGWGGRQEINKAAAFINIASNKDKFKRATELWYKIAVDPQYENHKTYQSMAKQAAQIKARLLREMGKKSNSVLRRRINRLNNVRIEAIRKLGEAFKVAEDLAKILAGFDDLKSQADPSQQVVIKNTKIGDAANAFMMATIAKSNAELDPKGQQLVKEAFDMNRLVIAQLGATTLQFFTSPMSGAGTLLSDWAALAPGLDRGIKASCQLNTSIETYGEKKNITIEQSDIIPDDDDEFEEG